ncbi:MAG: hypothetical protein Q8L81_16825 [Bacteroidota bacterium]|nr:hypothetical protein [Bacteroidota bacterium]
MKKFIVLLFFSFTLNAQFLWQVYPNKIGKWNYLDGDKFNKEKVNPEKLKVEDKTKVAVKNRVGQTIKELEILTNSEVPVLFNKNKQLIISANLKGQIFEEKIQV